MAQMLRKQIYIGKNHQALLRRLARLRGLSESEIIRQAIEHEAISGGELSGAPDAAALDAMIEYALSRRQLVSDGQAYRWNREEIYRERLDRFGSEPGMT